MSKRKILSAAKRLGIEIASAEYHWTPTPGESVPVWSIYLTAECADRLQADTFNQLDSTAQVLEWLDEIAHPQGEVVK